MKKIKVAVLMGGKSSEHEISILSGQQVVSNLNLNKYEILPVVISKTGDWKPESILDKKIDIVFIAMHGKYGEDGTIQGMLELSGIPYTGSGVLASSVGMNKGTFRKLMSAENLPIPKYIKIKKGYSVVEITKKLDNGPYFVKPENGGSSVGVSIVKNIDEIKKAVDLSFKHDDNVLVDEYIKGREITCALIGNDNPKALPVIEIKPLKGKFFDYESKYTESGAEEIVPADLGKSLTKEIQDLSIKVYKSLSCKGFGRVDFILKDNKEPIILEINTIPGLTPMSLLPKAARAAGISYSQLLDIIINNAIKKN